MPNVRPNFGYFSKYSFFVALLFSSYYNNGFYMRFALNTERPLREIWLLRYLVNNFLIIWKIWNSDFFFENAQNFLAYNSATNYLSEAVLYLTQTAGYSRSPHIKTIAVAFYELSNKATRILYFESFEKYP